MDLYPHQFQDPPLFVHRLDKGTSGALLVARSPAVRTLFNRLFQQGLVHKTYLALVEGVPEPDCGLIDQPLEEGRKGRYRIAPPGAGYPARTTYQVLQVQDGRSWVVCQPETGRTHQIRVHLAWLGCPLVKDPLYGKVRAKPSIHPELTLHAWRLEFPHPVSGESFQVEAPLPDWAASLPSQAAP
jgi:23S rRNA pseudouridine1911/1915/1917 synthase